MALTIQSNDGVFLRSRGNKYLNTPAGVGPQVVMSPNNSSDPRGSDEIWWIERIYSVVDSSGVNPLWSAASSLSKGPIYGHFFQERMQLDVKVSRTGIIEVSRTATIMKQSDTWRHIFQFSLVDCNRNTLWVSPIETLTLGAKVDSLGRPQNYSKTNQTTYNIAPADAEKVWMIECFMRQENTGGDSIIQQLQDAVDNLEKVDKSYKKIRDSTILKDAHEAFFTSS